MTMKNVVDVSILLAAILMLAVAALYHWRHRRLLRDAEADLFVARCKAAAPTVLSGSNFRIDVHGTEREQTVTMEKIR